MTDSRWGEPSVGNDPHLLARFEARPTDVLITTAPKAGTTWMQQLLHQLRSGGDTEFGSIYDVVPWLEFPGRVERSTEERLAAYAAIESPRVFKTHLPHGRMPGLGVAKVIVVARDPRDCLVSGYHHIRDMTPEMHAWLEIEPPASFDAHFERWIEGSWFPHVASWWPHRDDPNVLWLRYEDMKMDLGRVAERLLTHLGWDTSPEEVARALHLSSFEWMAANRHRFNRFSADEDASWKPEGFIRKGVVGDHRTLLTADHEARIAERAWSVLDPECARAFGFSKEPG